MDPRGYINLEVAGKKRRGRITFGSIRRFETETSKSVLELARLLDQRRLSLSDAIAVVTAVLAEGEEADAAQVAEELALAGVSEVMQAAVEVLRHVIVGLSGDVDGSAATEGKV